MLLLFQNLRGGLQNEHLALLLHHLEQMLLGSSVVKVDDKFSVCYIYRKIDVNCSTSRIKCLHGLYFLP